MSTHSYGRHGPNAWRKWHERRFEQPLPPRVAFVILHLPPTIERVVVVFMSNPTYGNPNPDFQNPTDGQNTGTHNDLRPETLDPVGKMDRFAFHEGKKKGRSDHEMNDILSGEELERDAVKLSEEYVDAPENQVLLAFHPVKIEERFKEQYQAGYIHGAKLNSVDELPSRWKRMIQRKAREDRERDVEQKGDALSEDEALAEAIRFGLDLIGQRSRETKQTVIEGISIYLEAYRNVPGRDLFRLFQA